mmetsp:Transcript_13428/g.23891  ORF Transcript_13428/g.23891 Transcript_13428/m.23891 type:complete len:248 (+) Transcript_13428:187-930(+)
MTNSPLNFPSCTKVTSPVTLDEGSSTGYASSTNAAVSSEDPVGLPSASRAKMSHCVFVPATPSLQTTSEATALIAPGSTRSEDGDTFIALLRRRPYLRILVRAFGLDTKLTMLTDTDPSPACLEETALLNRPSPANAVEASLEEPESSFADKLRPPASPKLMETSKLAPSKASPVGFPSQSFATSVQVTGSPTWPPAEQIASDSSAQTVPCLIATSLVSANTPEIYSSTIRFSIAQFASSVPEATSS